MNMLVSAAPWSMRSTLVLGSGVALGEKAEDVGSAPPRRMSWSSCAGGGSSPATGGVTFLSGAGGISYLAP
jgi:hypothetical protein